MDPGGFIPHDEAWKRSESPAATQQRQTQFRIWRDLPMGGVGAADSHDTVVGRDAAGAMRIAGAWNGSTDGKGASSGGVASCWQQQRTVC